MAKKRDLELRRFEMVDALSVRREGANHEFLKGGQGKSIFFRQERFRAGEVLDGLEDLHPRVIAEKFEGQLVDFALTGVSCLLSEAPAVGVGETLGPVWVSIGDRCFYKGKSKVVHLTPVSNDRNRQGWIVGLQLLDGVVDTDDVFRLRTESQIARAIDETKVVLARGDITPEYKRNVADFLFVLLRYRSFLSAQEEHLSSLGAGVRDEMESRVLESAWKTFRETIGETQQRLEDLTRDRYFDRGFQELYRSFTSPLVTPHVVPAPILHQAWAKPNGYAGDHMVMSYIYDQRWEGSSLYAKLIHKYGAEHPMSEAVRSRRDVLVSQIRRTVQEHTPTPDAACSIVSLGAGPAREVADFCETFDQSQPLKFTLVDQDNSSLAAANRRLSPLVFKGDSRVNVQYLFLSFAQILKDQHLFENVPRADLLYCSGLFDYLSTPKAKMLANWLFAKVAPGGALLIGNFASPANAAWTPTYLLDWNLRYRSDAEMAELTADLDGVEGGAEIFRDRTDLCVFVRVVKRHVR